MRRATSGFPSVPGAGPSRLNIAGSVDCHAVAEYAKTLAKDQETYSKRFSRYISTGVKMDYQEEVKLWDMKNLATLV
jgi:hypothetical protein